MMDDNVKDFLRNHSTEELANILHKRLQEYRAATLEPETTLSIPNLDIMILISGGNCQTLKKCHITIWCYRSFGAPDRTRTCNPQV